MSKSNNTGILILTLLIIAGLFSVAGAIIWYGLRTTNNRTSPVTVAPISPSTNSISLDTVPLNSERHVDYSKLRQYLQQKDWRAADRETYERMLDAAGSEAQAKGFTPQDEMDTFPCTDLKTIDQLWTKASDGKLGFTAQQEILRAVGDYRKMYDQVGWQKLPPSNEWLIQWIYNPQTKRVDYKPGKEPNFTNPLPGHLPTVERGYNFSVSLDGALKRCGF